MFEIIFADIMDGRKISTIDPANVDFVEIECCKLLPSLLTVPSVELVYSSSIRDVNTYVKPLEA